ncbi:MAG TPA: carboxypeptidase regulatory-like domain-containing protein [Terracidiphilus sp.]|nr:carboxypeptidase regulatory-like domain-containing protein [Terracidiphilus sp.]
MTNPARGGLMLQVLLAGAISAIVLPPAATRAQVPSTAATAGYRIAGRVVNSVTGEAVPGATLSAFDEEGNQVFASAIADQEGRFSIDHVPAGKYPLSASKRGYLTGYYDQHGDFNSAVVTGEGQDTANLVFQFTPSGVLRGVITDDGGDPVEGATVMLFKRSDATATAQHMRHMTNAATDDTGAYEFAGLEPGEYMVAVQAVAWYAQNATASPSAAPNPLDVAYPVTYFDSTTDEGAAQPITLDSGAREEADIVLHAVPALHFTMRVPAQTIRGDRFAPIEMRQSVFGNEISARTAMRGPSPDSPQMIEFTGLAPGRYELQQGEPAHILQLNAVTSGEIDPTAGTLAPPVSGTLRTSNGTALPDEINLVLAPADGGHQGVVAGAHKGRFQFDAVPAGEWTLAATSAGGAAQSLSVVGISTAGKETAGDRLTVADRPLSLVVTVSSASTRVKGFARTGGKAAPGAMIVLVPRDASAWPSLARRDQSDTDGSFGLADVPAGRYTVIAIEDGWKLDWQNRDVIARYLPGGEPVTITDQSGAVVQLARPVEAVAR